MKRDLRAEFSDPETQAEIMLKLFLAGHALSFHEIVDQLERKISAVAVAANCGSLQAKGWVIPAKTDGSARMELTVPGTDAVRQMFPSSTS
ncbi:MAG: hypothetical protein JST59_12535 [Actinobacteria bacterium]|nr:hypothetical protein [Actinomycetota bacterium]